MNNMMVLVSVKDALLNVVTGMVVVFLVLILISYLISLFRYIGVAQEKLAARKAKKAALSESTNNVVAQIEEKEETTADVTDDLLLVAVITAAIAASMGTSTDGFVVRSIRRAGKSNWKKA